MTTACSSLRVPLLALLAACLAVGLSGCQAIDLTTSGLEEPLPPPMMPAVEKSMVSLPSSGESP